MSEDIQATAFARIEGGVVVNLELWVQPPEVEGVSYVAAADARIGSAYSAEDGTFTPPSAPEPSFEERQAALRTALDEAYRVRLAADVSYDFGEAVAVDLDGETRAAGVLAMQMSQEDRENWQAKWSEALTADPSDVLVIQCEDRWYVQGPPSLFLGAFRYVLSVKQQLLVGKKILARLIDQATTTTDLDNVEAAIANPVWAIA